MHVKRSTKPVVEVKAVCQLCQYHSNRPSTCLLILSSPIPTGRKETCRYSQVDQKKLSNYVDAVGVERLKEVTDKAHHDFFQGE